MPAERNTCEVCGAENVAVRKNNGVMACNGCSGMQSKIKVNLAAVLREAVRLRGQDDVAAAAMAACPEILRGPGNGVEDAKAIEQHLARAGVPEDIGPAAERVRVLAESFLEAKGMLARIAEACGTDDPDEMPDMAQAMANDLEAVRDALEITLHESASAAVDEVMEELDGLRERVSELRDDLDEAAQQREELARERDSLHARCVRQEERINMLMQHVQELRGSGKNGSGISLDALLFDDELVQALDVVRQRLVLHDGMRVENHA